MTGFRLREDQMTRWYVTIGAGCAVAIAAAIWLMAEGLAGRVPTLGVGLGPVGALISAVGVAGMRREDKRELARLREEIRQGELRQASATRYAPFDSGPAAHIAQPREDA
jgi:hypothetical protein